MRDLINDAAFIGIGECRKALALQDQVASTYKWNNGVIWKSNEKIKDTLDLNGILQSGRSGIWGKEYRGNGFELKGGEENSVSGLVRKVGDLNLQSIMKLSVKTNGVNGINGH